MEAPAFGYTNVITVCVAAAGAPPTQLESFDAIGVWTPIVPTNISIESVNQIEGAGAFALTSNPFGGAPGGVTVSGGISGLGAPPWNLSFFTFLQIYLVKEFDPGEGSPLDFFDITLKDAFAASATVSTPVPGINRQPGPHVISSGDFQPIQIPTAGFGGIDLTVITEISLKIIDINAGVPLGAWFDNMEGVP